MGRPKAVRKSTTSSPFVAAKKTRGKRYTNDEKTQILEKAQAEISKGGQITKIADKLGVTFFTLKSWLKEKGVVKVAETTVVKRGRGRPSTKTVKSIGVTVSKPSASKKQQVVERRKETVSSKPDYVKELERKIEELMQKTKKLSHLYGELRSEVGINDK